MAATKTRGSLLAGFGLGLALLGVWLVGWRLLSDAAGWFAPATALIGVVLWLISLTRQLAGLSILRVALRTAGWGAMLLAAMASLSLGAFLPAGLAEWASPVLGRFGGGAALLILGMGMFLGVATNLAHRRGILLDLTLGFSLAALWVWTQVERQASFPPPPTTSALLSSRLDFLFVLALLLAFLSIPALWLERQASRRIARSTPGSRLLRAFAIRWAVLLTILGLIGSLLVGSNGWYWFGLPVLVLVIGGLAARMLAGGDRAASQAGRVGRAGLRMSAWLIAGLLLSALVIFTTSEDLEVIMLRNSIEWRVMQFWRGVAGDERFEARSVGTLSGRVRDTQGQPLEGAAVVLSEVSGQVYSSRTAPDGTYRIERVPRGNYLPMAVAPTYRQGAPTGPAGRVATVRTGQETQGVNFVLERNKPLELASQIEMNMGQPEEVSVEHPKPSTARRRTFEFRNGGMLLTGGLVHEPLEELGPGPFPILLIVYPGEARAWEGVSVPLATNGYVVISYFPRRLIDLEGDVDDLRVLTSLAAGGRLSERGDTSRVVLVGGSVSTVYTYLMAREMEGSRVEDQMKGAIQYGGLFDMFRYRLDWEQGKIEIDPGISDLEYLLVAFGRADARPEIYLRFSPRYALGPDSLPPTLLVHAGNDVIVPAEQSHITDRELSRLGTPHDFLLYPNIEHYLDTSKRDPTQIDMLNKTLDFLREHVK